MKILFGLILLLVFTPHLYSQKVSKDIAQNVALNFYKTAQSADRLSSWDGCVEFVEINDVGDFSTYVFQINHDFVVVSADRSKRPIQAFSLDGKFNPEIQLPAAGLGLVRDLSSQEEQLHPLDQQYFPQETSEPAVKDYSAAWDFYENGVALKSASSTQEVLPLMSTQWGQEEFYNDSMPADPAGPGGNVMVGCVSTALGQYMKYIADTEGSFPGFGWAEWTWDNWGSPPPNYPTQYADFENANYNYSLMPDQLTSSTPANQKAEVARFLADLGVAVKMQYSPTASATSEFEAWYAMLNYFSFNAGVRVMGQKDANLEYFPIEVWTEMLTDELDAGRVFMYGGRADNGSWSHWFVIDGYNTDPVTGDVMFHCNWGWHGAGDGYYPLDNLAPLGFVALDDGQTAIFGMHPDEINITADTTVSGTWNVPRSILVRETATLTIAPGTVVTVADGAEILVHGALVAIGDSSNKITFTVADTATDRFNSIRIEPRHTKFPQVSSVIHCIIEYSERDMPGAKQPQEFWGGGLYLPFRLQFGHDCVLSHTEVRYCRAFGGAGLQLENPGEYIGLQIHHNSMRDRLDLHGNRTNSGKGNGMCITPWGFAEGFDHSFTFDSCSFSYNSGPAGNAVFEGAGGGVYIGLLQNFSVNIKNSQFIGNTYSYRGVAIYSDNALLTITNCVFRDHDFVLPYGASAEGIIYIKANSDYPGFPSFVGNLTTIGCLFEDNTLPAIWTSTDDTVTVINTTVRNHQLISSGGSFITVGETNQQPGDTGNVHINVVNTLVWGNDPNHYSIYRYTMIQETPILNIQYSDIQGGNAAIDPNFGYTFPSTNIDANPLFATNGQLLPNSPCIDAGTPDTTGLNLPDFDFFGWERIMYSRVDIGASEYDGTVSIPKISWDKTSAIKVYPNPTNGTFSIQLDGFSEPLDIFINTIDGRIVKKYQNIDMNSHDNIIQCKDLARGTYFIQFIGGTNKLTSMIIVY